MPDVPLSDAGRAQAESLARALAPFSPDAVQASPVARAQETAAAIAARCGCAVETVAALDEIDFGDWTGRRFDALADDPDWRRWNEQRSQSRAPGGEAMRDAQARVLDHLHDSSRCYAGGTVVMVTHCDIIRAAVAGVLGLSLDRILQFDVAPASVSRIAAGDWGSRVVSVNEELRCDP